MYVLHVNPITSAKWDGSKIPKEQFSSGAATPADPERAVTPTVEEKDDK